MWLWVVTPAAATPAPHVWQVPGSTEQIVLGPIEVRYEPGMEAQARALASSIPGWWSSLESALGEDVDDRLTLHLTSHAGELARASGTAGWANGVARPAAGEMIVTMFGPDGRPVAIEGVVRHELAHVALHRAVGGARVPAWFHEGVADNLGDEISPGRREALARGYAGGVPSLEALSVPFQGDATDIATAYAVSRDFVAYLWALDQGGDKFPALIDAIRRGRGFERAVVDTYGATVATLGAQWREGLWSRFSWAPLATSPDAFLVLLSPLGVVAWWRRRRRNARAYDRLDDDLFPFGERPWSGAAAAL